MINSLFVSHLTAEGMKCKNPLGCPQFTFTVYCRSRTLVFLSENTKKNLRDTNKFSTLRFGGLPLSGLSFSSLLFSSLRFSSLSFSGMSCSSLPLRNTQLVIK